MSLFEKHDPGIEKLTEEIRELRKSVAGLKGERDALRGERDLAKRVEDLQKQVTAKEIELDREKEKHARTEREIDHKLGLHRAKVEQEMELAEQATRVAVREENLSADRDRFKDQIEFTRKAMADEMSNTRDLMKQMMERLPKFEVLRKEQIGLPVGNGNGKADGDGE